MFTIENYESHYVDYLEGTLPTDMQLAFEAFLAAHPELVLEDSGNLPILTIEENDRMDEVSKLALKKDITIADLSEETLGFFLIAKNEGLLSVAEQVQLENWIGNNPAYLKESALYAATKLQPIAADFAGKSKLKQKETRIIPMWFIGAASLAAGVALLVSINWKTGSSGDENFNANHTKPQKPKVILIDSAGNSIQPLEIAPENRGTFQLMPKRGTQKKIQSQPVIVPNQAPIDGFAFTPKEQLAPQQAPDINPKLIVLPNQPEAPLRVTPVVPDPVVSNQDMAFADMKNPVAPITEKLAERLHTAVDFRTAKPTKENGGGFYFKLGKFEISHKRGSGK